MRCIFIKIAPACRRNNARRSLASALALACLILPSGSILGQAKQAADQQATEPDSDPRLLPLPYIVIGSDITESKEPEKPKPPPPEPEPLFLPLPYRSFKPAAEYVETGIQRYVTSLGYQLDETQPDSSRCNDPERWCFHRQPSETEVLDLSVTLEPFPEGRHELHFYGEKAERKSVDSPPTIEQNPDVADLRKKFSELTAELKVSSLGNKHDKFFTYPLSYIQADRAVAVLKSLGYPVVEYVSRKPDEGETPLPADRIFSEVTPPDKNRRPLVFNLIDSQITTLITTPTQIRGRSATPTETLTGGQKMDQVTDATPQQRLLIVYDNRHVQDLDRLLVQLRDHIDVQAKQISMEALIIEIDRNLLRDIGVDFSGDKNNYDVSFQEANGVIQPFTYTWNQPAARTFLTFMAKLRALEDSGAATIRAQPEILVLDGRQARIKVADEIPYTQALELNEGGSKFAVTGFITAGIILNLKPRATFDNSEVSIQAEVIISSAGASRVQPDTGVIIAPTVQTRQVQTLIRVANDTPFVIGGLISNTTSEKQTGIPWLKKIPGLGRLFRKDSLVEDQREVIVVLTPHIVSEDDRTFSRTIPRDGDVFDTFGAELFGNVYRVRRSDIFDLSFITESEGHRERVELIRNFVRRKLEIDFDRIPNVDSESLIQNLKERAALRFSDEALRSFLTFFQGDVPGEEHLVHRMMLQILERREARVTFKERLADVLGPAEARDVKDTWYYDDLVPPKKIVFLKDGETDAGYLIDDPEYEECLPKGRTLEIKFSGGSALFSPPSATIQCLKDDVKQGDFVDELAKSYWSGEPRILLNNQYLGRRKPGGDKNGDHQTPLELLQSVLALRRLLELNDEATFPRTIRAFHAGREVVFPTKEDLQERTYFLDRRTAELFYETLDYYAVFQGDYNRERLGLSFATFSEFAQGTYPDRPFGVQAPPSAIPPTLNSAGEDAKVRFVGTPETGYEWEGDAGLQLFTQFERRVESESGCSSEIIRVNYKEAGESLVVESEETVAATECPTTESSEARNEATNVEVVEPPRNASDEISVRRALDRWRSSWESRDVPRYLGSYADDFFPATGETNADWRAGRVEALERPNWIRLDLVIEGIEPLNSSYRVRFQQGYESNLLCDRESKTLIFAQTEGDWLIVAEEIDSKASQPCPGRQGRP